MSEEIMTVDITSQHIVINQDRSVAVPSLIKKSIVQRDHNIERLTFDCPRYWYGKDISTLNIYVNYISVNQKAKGDDPGSSLCENVVIDENDQDMMHFDWVITNNVSQDVGGLLFLVCAKSVDSDGNEDVHWNSHLCKELEVQEGLEASGAIVKRYPDVIESILSKLGKQIELRNSGTAIQYRNAGENTWVDLVQLEDIKGDAAVIIESNFKGSDTTANILAKTGETGDKWYSTDDGVYYMFSSKGEWINCGSGENLKKIEDEITELKSDLEELKNQGTSGGTGLTASAINALLDCFKNVAWANENGQTYYDALQNALLENRVSVSGIELSKSSANIYTGYSADVSATIIPSDASDKSVTWSSSDENIAVVEANGLNATIKGISDGSAIITCTTNDGGYIDTFAVTVATATVGNITLNTTQGSLAVGQTVELIATVSPNEVADKTVIWTTSSSSIATVTPSVDTATALIEAVSEGTATITATCGGKSATYTCVVEAVELEAVVPELYCRTETGKMSHYYYADDIDTLDTSDTSQIVQKAYWRMLCFDCSDASTIRLKRNVLSKGYSNSPVIYAFNHKPITYSYVSDVTTSPTTDAAYKFITLPLTGYNNNISVGDVVTVGDYELDSNYKWLVLIYADSTSSSSSDLADYVDENGFYDAVASDTIKIEIVN